MKEKNYHCYQAGFVHIPVIDVALCIILILHMPAELEKVISILFLGYYLSV
jgi:hypothetical protein